MSNKSCPRMLWLSGVQAVTASGGSSHYLDSSSQYLRYYASAIKSARMNAPSLLPVLVFLNSAPDKYYLEWVLGQEALVIEHKLSFQERITRAIENDPGNPKLAKIEHLAASYARLDIAAIMEKVRAEVKARQLANIDTEYALWSDPDVLFEQDINSCSLPKPRLVSIGAETIPGTVANCGVMYYHVDAFGKTLNSLLDFADSKGWMFDDDQNLFRSHYKRWMINALPDAYNYKPYWGEKEFIRPAPLYKEQSLAEVAIIHTHGPKPTTALCVIDYIKKNQVPVHVDRDSVLPHVPELVRRCEMANLPWLDVVLKLIASAAVADGGRMYQRVLQLHAELCPGACWMEELGSGGAQAGGERIEKALPQTHRPAASLK